jgi:hypothetical protein
MIQAGVDRRMGPFTLRVGDCVNPMLRPAGMLMPNPRPGLQGRLWTDRGTCAQGWQDR